MFHPENFLKGGLLDPITAPKHFQYNSKVHTKKFGDYNVYLNLDEIWKHLLLNLLSEPIIYAKKFDVSQMTKLSNLF